jgi:hypothetical protein
MIALFEEILRRGEQLISQKFWAYEFRVLVGLFVRIQCGKGPEKYAIRKNNFLKKRSRKKTSSSPIVTSLLFPISAAGYSDALGFGSRLTVDDDGSPARHCSVTLQGTSARSDLNQGSRCGTYRVVSLSAKTPEISALTLRRKDV